MQYKMTEWQSASGQWHCNCVDRLATNAGAWYTPARILGLSPVDYVKLVLSKYKPDNVTFHKEKCLFFFSWNSNNQAGMRKFKNDINAAARQANFQI